MAAAAATGTATVRDAIDVDKNGKVSKSEFAAGLDENQDGKVTKHEAADLDRDGKVEKKEKDIVDSNNDGKTTRHEVLAAPEADVNHDGKVTAKEKKAVLLFPPPPPLGRGGAGAAASAPPLHALPGTSRPPRTSWTHGLWDTWEDAVDEFVLLAVFFITLHAFFKGVQKKLAGKGGKYKSVAKVSQQEMDAYRVDDDPGLELANDAPDAQLQPAPESEQRLNDSEMVGRS
jgi:hypothetical protein